MRGREGLCGGDNYVVRVGVGSARGRVANIAMEICGVRSFHILFSTAFYTYNKQTMTFVCCFSRSELKTLKTLKT